MGHDGGKQPTEHIPTLESRAKVVGFSCAGFPQESIAKYLRISDDTLRKHYPDELDQAKMDKIEFISTNVYKLAAEGNEKMMEFVLKCQGRWSYAKPPEESEKDKQQMTLMEKLIDKL